MAELVLDKKILDDNNKKVVIHQEIPIAIVKYNGKIHAFDNRCPHRGGSLYKGSIKLGYISCPLHNWEFNLESGLCRENKNIKINNYKVRESKNSIIIKFDKS